jgi:peptidyl-prolyl cis-trans isomerase-like 4
VYNVQKGFSFQTGDPVGPDSKDSDGGSSIWGHISGDAKRNFPAEIHPKLKHAERGTVSMATVQSQRDPDERLAGSQFIITLGDNLDFLDGKAAIFGKVVEGFDALEKINEAFCDERGRPLVDVRIKHTVVLDDPYDDPSGLVEPPESPVPTKAQLATVRIGEDDKLDDENDVEAIEKQRRERDARAQALTLEMVGDLPFAEVKPPENVLFVCKLNPVTTGKIVPFSCHCVLLTNIDEDLELIFSRFGKILSCEVIRDKRTGDSLQYSFIEYEDQASCEQAYFKMQGVLIDDHRIHVDFSQSVSKLSDSWRTSTNSKRRQGGGGFGGVSGLEKKRQYKAADYGGGTRRDRYGMVYDEEEMRRRHEREGKYDSEKRERSRSRSPQRDRRHHDDGGRDGGGRQRGGGDRYDDRDYGRRRGGGDGYRGR